MPSLWPVYCQNEKADKNESTKGENKGHLKRKIMPWFQLVQL